MSTVKLAPGRLAGQYCRALIVAKGDPGGAAGWSTGRGFPDAVARAAVASHDRDNTDLISIRADFAAVLAAVSAVDRLSGGRLSPFDTRGVLSTGGASAAWLLENRPIPLSTAPLVVGGVLTATRVAGLSVVTSELARSTVAEEAILGSLIDAIVRAVDSAFLDPLNFGPDTSPSTSAAPASPLAGLSALANPAAVLATVAAAGTSLLRAAWVTDASTLAKLATMTVGADPTPVYPGVSALGGRIYGIPVIVAPGGNPPGQLALFDADYIRFAADLPELETSRSATLQFETEPTNGPTAATSLFQSNAIALRATQFRAWSAVGSNHAAYTVIS